jgi:hypothetical protein
MTVQRCDTLSNVPTICFRVSEDLAARVEAAAQADDRSVSWFARRALEERLANGDAGRGLAPGLGKPASPRARRAITPRPKGKR